MTAARKATSALQILTNPVAYFVSPWMLKLEANCSDPHKNIRTTRNEMVIWASELPSEILASSVNSLHSCWWLCDYQPILNLWAIDRSIPSYSWYCRYCFRYVRFLIQWTGDLCVKHFPFSFGCRDAVASGLVISSTRRVERKYYNLWIQIYPVKYFLQASYSLWLTGSTSICIGQTEATG